MSSPPKELEGCRARFERCQKTIEELGRDIGVFLDKAEASAEIRMTPDADGQSATGEIVTYFNEPVPSLQWSPIISEFAHHMRSSLDNLAHQLGILYSGKPLPHKTEFPIFLKRDRFHRTGKDGKPTPTSGFGKMRCLAPLHQEIIESLQPYHAADKGMPPERTALWVLHELSNLDKHADLHLLVGIADGYFEHHLVPQSGRLEIIERLKPGASERETVLARFRFWPNGGPEPGVYFNVTPRFEIAFGRETPTPRMPVRTVMTAIAEEAGSIFGRFEAAFFNQN